MQSAPHSRSSPTELPDLDPGVQLLETEVDGALPALVVDRVLAAPEERTGAGADRRAATPDDTAPDERAADVGPTGGHRALWADANGHARTRAIADVAPDRRVLRRIDVARGFTAYQHYAVVDAMAERATGGGVVGTAGGDADHSAAPSDADHSDADRPGVALLVAPAIDAPYRDDGLRGDEGRDMLVRALATLAGAARRLECPVLVTRTRDDDLAAPVASAADRTITCERTPAGPRFAAEDFETLVYPVGDGAVQTTFAFWRRVLERRAPDGALGGAGTAATAAATESEPDGSGEPDPLTSAAGPAASADPRPFGRPTDSAAAGGLAAPPEVIARGSD